MKQIWILFLPLLFALLLFPSESAQGIAQGLAMCGSAVIPALFPFFFLTRLLASLLTVSGGRADALLRRFLGISGSLPALLLSFLGGYPVGVSSVVFLYERGAMTKREAERAVCFCNNSGPGFFVGAVGGIALGSVKAGLTLYGIHVLAAVLCGRLFADFSLPSLTVRRIVPKPVSFPQAFQEALGGACQAMLTVCALVILFSAFLALLEAVGFFSLAAALPVGLSKQALQAIVCGILEVSGGVLRTAGCESAFVLCAFFMGWGGLCVHLQAMSLWQGAGLAPHGYFAEKLAHGLLSLLFALATQEKSPLLLLLCVIAGAVCVIFPRIRKKRGSNLRQVAV